MFEGATNLPESTRHGILRDDLDDFVAVPVTPDEVKTKADFYSRVQPWLSEAMMVAGYPLKEMDDRLKLVFEKKDFFNRDAESIATDVNRIIANWVVEARTFAKAYDKEVLLQSSPFAPKEQPVRSADDKVPQSVEVNSQVPDLSSNSSIENIREAENLPVETELDERADEYVEYSNHPIAPTRLAPQFSTAVPSEVAPQNLETKPQEALILKEKLSDTLVLTKEQILPDSLVLTPEMQVAEPNEPIVLQTAEGVDEINKSEVESGYQSKLDKLNQRPFDSRAYLDYFMDVHTGLRSEYDTAVTSARTNLKRYSALYTPSKTEKEALQFLSRLQAQYAKMQNAGSSIGIIRAQLLTSLEDDSSQVAPEDIKNLTQTYTTEVEQFLGDIKKLEDLIEAAKSEEKPPLAEAYRAQFEKMRVEGNQVLQSLPASHPLYGRLKFAIEGDSNNKGDLIKLIEAAAIDKAVLENSSSFIARRDQIKNLITFVKQEQEYQDFFTRAQARVQKLESAFEHIPAGNQSEQVKRQLAENIVKVKQALAETTSQVATVGVLENLQEKKNTVQGLLGESEELIKIVPTIEAEIEGNEAITAPDEVLLQKLKEKVARVPVQDIVPAEFMAQYERHMADKKERERKLRETPTNLERFKNLARKIPLGNIIKAAAVVLASTLPLGQENKQGTNPMMGGPLVAGGILAQPNVNYAAIYNYLKTIDVSTPEVVASAEVMSAPAPKPELSNTTSAPTEVVPGVVFPENGVNSNSEIKPNFPKFYSAEANNVPIDPGIVLEAPQNTVVPEILKTPYTLNIGDTFWDINEGQTIAGKLPVLSQIKSGEVQQFIDVLRDRINNDAQSRDSIGGFGSDASRPYADQLIAGKQMNLNKLNDLAMTVAVENNFLK